MTSLGLSGGPTALRILLGSQLRRLREGRGISAQAAARAIRGSESKISRIELGRNAVREIDVADLLTLYGVTDPEEREQLLTLASQANRPGWWYRFNDILPSWFQAYIGLEEAAESIRTYEAQFLPGLLQTEGYAAAVLALGDIPADEMERYVMLRKQRQRRFAAGELRLWAVVDEDTLRRPVGDPQALREQLSYLLQACQSRNLVLQVIPRGVGGHAAPSGFSILRFGDPEMPDIVYVEQLTSALYLDKRPEVDRYLLAMERMSIVATEPRASTQVIKAILEEMGGPA
jgi:transcriptional regulator with XRE-family HTH domain